MQYKPHDYQQYAINYILEHPIAAVILGMGLGKTSITLTAIEQLMYGCFEISKVLVVEAAIENLDIKKSIFKELDEVCKPETILASNTSSISITAIAAATKRPQQVLGMHFFNPAPAMKLVEVIRGARTNDETFQAVYGCAKDLGKNPVEVGEAPGFVVNRILFPMINEAIIVLENGIASKEDIDTAMMYGANHKMGPLALADLVGLDICLAIMETIYTETGDSKYRPALTMKKMVRAGLLGQKTGEGFYKY